LPTLLPCARNACTFALYVYCAEDILCTLSQCDGIQHAQALGEFMSEGYGPGIGSLIGLKMGSVKAAAEAHDQDLKAMRAELRNAVAGGLYDQAFAQAAADVTAEIIEEVKQEQAGKTGARRLSDPANVQGRNEAYVQRAEAHVRRLSGGKVRMSPEDKALLKKQRHVK
jgi:hypothetical protein